MQTVLSSPVFRGQIRLPENLQVAELWHFLWKWPWRLHHKCSARLWRISKKNVTLSWVAREKVEGMRIYEEGR